MLCIYRSMKNLAAVIWRYLIQRQHHPWRFAGESIRITSDHTDSRTVQNAARQGNSGTFQNISHLWLSLHLKLPRCSLIFLHTLRTAILHIFLIWWQRQKPKYSVSHQCSSHARVMLSQRIAVFIIHSLVHRRWRSVVVNVCK